MDSWENACSLANGWISDSNDWCSNLWSYSMNVTTNLKMPFLEGLGQAIQG